MNLSKLLRPAWKTILRLGASRRGVSRRNIAQQFAFGTVIALTLATTEISHAVPISAPGLVTYTYSGVLDPIGDLFPGGPFSGSITMDAFTPPRPHCCWVEYASRPSFSFALGDVSWSKKFNTGDSCSLSVLRTRAGTRDTFDFDCVSDQDRLSPNGRMIGWWRFANFPSDDFRGWDIPLGPFAPDEYQDGWIRAQFFIGARVFLANGTLQLTSVRTVGEPDELVVLCIGLVVLLAVAGAKKPTHNSSKQTLVHIN